MSFFLLNVNIHQSPIDCFLLFNKKNESRQRFSLIMLRLWPYKSLLLYYGNTNTLKYLKDCVWHLGVVCICPYTCKCILLQFILVAVICSSIISDLVPVWIHLIHFYTGCLLSWHLLPKQSMSTINIKPQQKALHSLLVEEGDVSKLLPPGPVHGVGEARVVWVQLGAVGQDLVGKAVQLADWAGEPWDLVWSGSQRSS